MKVISHNSARVTWAHLLEIGDIFRIDESYKITSISEDLKNISLLQKTEYNDKTKQRSVCFDAEFCTPSVSHRGENFTLSEVLRVNSISIRGKFFIVASDRYTLDEDSHKLTAKECDTHGNIKKDGLSLTFTQLGVFHCQTDIYFPNCVGHNMPAVAALTEEKASIPKVA